MAVLNPTPPPEKLLKNRYRIIQSIGSGGFSETFLAEDTQMPSRRRCVIKQLRPADEQRNHAPEIYPLIRERFDREATILEELGEISGQIPRLYAYFEEEGQFYLVQEWIEGKTLMAHVQYHGLFRETAVREILIKTLPVLDLIHRRGLIHRDIKPDNIILNHPQDKPVLIDFGAVKETMGTTIDSKGQITKSIAIGTPGFMAAEQAAGHPVYSSDLYSLGLTAIYLLTGKAIPELQFTPEQSELSWRQYAPQVSPRLAHVLSKAVQFHPRDRFFSAEEMLQELQDSLSPIPPTEPSLPPSTLILPKQDSQVKRQASAQLDQHPIVQNLLRFWSGLEAGQKALAIGVASGIVVCLLLAVVTRLFSASPETEVGTQTISEQELQVANLPRSFYFIADSAFYDPSKAETKRQQLVNQGYPNAGFFWSPNYTNFANNNSYKVYADWFTTKSSCEAALPKYQEQNPVAYCGFATKSPGTKPIENNS
ncbi:MAG: protein kinase [Microcoleaceae cyanobacterium]